MQTYRSPAFIFISTSNDIDDRGICSWSSITLIGIFEVQPSGALILFPENFAIDWKLGLPFFRKYNFFVFDIDKKTIGIYTKNNGFNFVIWDLLIIFLIIVIIIMGWVIYYLLSKKQRKIRANELDEQFEYLNYK